MGGLNVDHNTDYKLTTLVWYAVHLIFSASHRNIEAT